MFGEFYFFRFSEELYWILRGFSSEIYKENFWQTQDEKEDRHLKEKVLKLGREIH